MSVIYIVLPLALFVILIAVLAYVWAAKRGQFDDLTTPAIRVLHDDPPSKDVMASATLPTEPASDSPR